MRRWIVLAILIVAVSPSHALPPGSPGHLRDGANHRLGDDSFFARYGRPPTARDSEKLRMRTHLEYVHAYLSARPATKPELAATRARLLAFLAEYRDAGITPKNTQLPWRSPVFIDDTGNICAVGYLIERSVGRELAETIAASHRHDFLEDIAADMPEVARWIESSGLTLTELASIQPGYEGAELPWVEQWDVWTARFGDAPKMRGRFEREESERLVKGRFVGGKMHGKWTKKTKEGTLVGSGRFHEGSGTWRSLDANGKRMAEGPIIDNRPNGTWRLYHPSGNLAAKGRMSSGQRHGEWTFYYDTKTPAPISKGRFVRGSYAKGAYVGTWKHYNPDGSLLATATSRSKRARLVFAGSAKRARHEVSSTVEGRIDAFSYKGVRILRRDDSYAGGVSYFDADGNRLEHEDGKGWFTSACKWSVSTKRHAKAGRFEKLQDRISAPLDDCADPVAVPEARGKLIDAALASETKTPMPEFITALMALGPAHFIGEPKDDMRDMLASNMSDGFAWPHINVRFMDVFVTLPGYVHPMLCPGDCRY